MKSRKTERMNYRTSKLFSQDTKHRGRHCSLTEDGKYYAKTITGVNPKVWTNFLVIVMKVGTVKNLTTTVYSGTFELWG